MDSPLLLIAILGLPALVGHWLLFAAVANRGQAAGLAVGLDHVVTATHWLLLPAVPAAFLITERPWTYEFAAAVRAGDFCPVWGTYFAVCYATLLVTVGERLIRAVVSDQIPLTTATRLAVERPHAPPEPDRARHPLALIARLPLNESGTFEVHEYPIGIAGLADRWNGLRIAHLGDLHVTGDVGLDYFRRVVEVTNGLRPDLIVVSGDLLDREELLDAFVESVAPLEAPLGVAFVFGNHDLRHGPDATRERLREAGWTHVGGRAEVFRDGDDTLILAGDERPWFGGPPTSPTDASALRVLVSHTPDNFSAACRAGYDLVLSGHNHGGQVRLPGLGAVYSPSLTGTRYAGGLYRRGRTTLHVTRGLSAEIPLRFRCPAEVAVLTLGRSEAAL
ncbi:MAG: metallophosphoesterase [Planctomycetota bacterium]